MLHAIWQIIGAPIALGIDTSAVESDVQNRCQEFGKGEVNLAISKKKLEQIISDTDPLATNSS